jgi:hypothetical protein
MKLPEYTKDYPDVALVPIVSSLKAADLIVRRWESCTEGSRMGLSWRRRCMRGGHLGATKMEQITDPAFSLEVVVPELVNYIANTVNPIFRLSPPEASGGGRICWPLLSWVPGACR